MSIREKIIKEFKRDLKIDPEALDVNAGMQGELFFKWSERLIDSKKKMEACKLELEVLTAQLSSKARMSPKSFGIVKLTEAAIDVAIRTHSDYVSLYEILLEHRSHTALLEKAVEAMEQRKRMIEVLVTLHGQQYFAGPSVPRNLVEAWSDVQRERAKLTSQKKKIRKRSED